MRYLATVSYDGTSYVGWQVQPNGLSVEECIEKAISQILNKDTKIFASGRTDAGVHALGQTFHFDSDVQFDIGKFLYSLNCLLPEDIHILRMKQVSDDFSARFNAVSKTYRYILNEGQYDVFNRKYANQFLRTLDVSSMQEASSYFIGEHNFQNFTSKEEDDKGFARKINSFCVKKDGNNIVFEVNGNGFMRYMVRMMVGALIEIGLGKQKIEYVREKLCEETRNQVPYRAKPCGLFLVEVSY